MLALISRRKAGSAFVALVFLFLFFVHSPSSPDRLPYNSPAAASADAPVPTFVEVEDGRFHWSRILQRYPVQSMIPMPTATTKIPRIQHEFPAEDAKARETRLARLAAVKENFEHAWAGYKAHAWLSDEVAPISGGAKNHFGGWAATLVDSLDTLWIMGLTDEFEEAVRAIGQIDFSTCALEELNVFETTIRYLGGFLSAYDLSGGKYPVLVQKAMEMGHMLYVAFDTPNRMPVTRWNFKAAASGALQEAHEGALVAEIGSLTLEFTRLAQITKDARYFDAVQRIMDVFEAQQNDTKLPGMWPIVVDANKLDFTEYDVFTIGGMADSLYEYLPKQHLLLGGATEQYRRLYEISAAPMKKHMFYRPMTPGNRDILMPGDVSTDGKKPPTTVYLEPKNQHLSCFAGGMFAIAGKIFENPEDLEVGRKLVEGCLWAYETNSHGIMPEIMYTIPCDDAERCPWDQEKWIEAIETAYAKDDEFSDAKTLIQEKHLKQGIAKINDGRYILRPEAIESIFILYRITGDKSLPDRAWTMFDTIINNTRTSIAHAGLDDCTADEPRKSDSMESFWLAETLKYFYLIYSEPELVSLDEYVLNTEAHPLRRPAAGV